MVFCRWIPDTILSSFRCLGRQLFVTNHGRLSLICHMADARSFTMCAYCIEQVHNSTTPEFSMFTRSLQTNVIMMFRTLLVFIQSPMSSGNILSTLFIDFGSLMNYISCSWVYFKIYYTACSNTWTLEMSKINSANNFDCNHDIKASSMPLHHSISWNVALGSTMRWGVWSANWLWDVVKFSTTPRTIGTLQLKWPWMILYSKQCRHYVNSLYLLANKIHLI